MNAMKEKASLKGRLCLKVIRDGKIIHEARDNLIVTAGRNALAKLLGGQTGMHVSTIGIGTGSVAAAASDTDLTGAATVTISETRVGTGLEAEDGTIFDAPNIVQFHFVFSKDVGVGMSVSEYGLFCADGTLFSRVVRDSPFTKTSLDKIVGFWQITF